MKFDEGPVATAITAPPPSSPDLHKGSDAKWPVGGDENGNGLAVRGFEDGNRPLKIRVPVRREDEYEVDFSDTRKFFVHRWDDIVKTTTDRMTTSGIRLLHRVCTLD
jgi:hypothetical protein